MEGSRKYGSGRGRGYGIYNYESVSSYTPPKEGSGALKWIILAIVLVLLAQAGILSSLGF